MPTVLLIDDDTELAELLIEYGKRFSMTITASQRPTEAIALLKSDNYDAVILDVMLPEMDGFDTCREIRKFSDVPIIMLTARGEVTDRIVGLELGADDYLPKPFDPRELMARINANVKRKHQSTSSSVLEFESLTIDLQTQEVRVNQTTIKLTTKEYELLTLLASTPGKTYSRDDLISALRGTDHELFSRSIDILVSRLRQKLKPAAPIKTVHGAGYAFTARSV